MARVSARENGVADVDVVRAFGLERREGGEDELRMESEEIERAFAVLGVERAVGVPALRIHELGFVASRSRWICGAGLAAFHHLLARACSGAQEGEGGNANPRNWGSA